MDWRMSDLTERLRRFDARTPETLREAWGAMLEAADEIERLRECLFQMQEAAKQLAAFDQRRHEALAAAIMAAHAEFVRDHA